MEGGLKWQIDQMEESLVMERAGCTVKTTPGVARLWLGQYGWSSGIYLKMTDPSDLMA